MSKEAHLHWEKLERFSAPLKWGAFVEKALVFAKDSGEEKKKDLFIYFFLEWRKQRARAVRCQAFDYFFNFQGREMKEGRENNDEEMWQQAPLLSVTRGA